MTDMEKFSVFLRYAENPDHREIVNRVIESKEGLAVAGEVLMSVSKDEREKAIFRSRRMALADQESNRITAERNLKTALLEAEKRVDEAEKKADEAEKAKAIAIAKNLLMMNLPIEQIVKATGLTREEIEGLRDAD
jgi:cytochrome c-type biogenesis protein CcmH/NrfG